MDKNGEIVLLDVMSNFDINVPTKGSRVFINFRTLKHVHHKHVRWKEYEKLFHYGCVGLAKTKELNFFGIKKIRLNGAYYWGVYWVILWWAF